LALLIVENKNVTGVGLPLVTLCWY